MPAIRTTIGSLSGFFLRFTFLIVVLYGATGLITACGSSTTIIFQNPANDDEDDDSGDEVTAKAPNSPGTPVIHTQTQHLDLLLSGGSAIPIIYSRTPSGSVEISSDLDY